LTALSESQARHAAALRELAHILLGTTRAPRTIEPVPTAPPPTAHDDACDCEICGRSVAADDMSGFAWRHGAMVHINCLAGQMDARRL
jgi:hypothetical protein